MRLNIHCAYCGQIIPWLEKHRHYHEACVHDWDLNRWDKKAERAAWEKERAFLLDKVKDLEESEAELLEACAEARRRLDRLYRLQAVAEAAEAFIADLNFDDSLKASKVPYIQNGFKLRAALKSLREGTKGKS